ncbi:MFS transporter [bacterium]|nr:MFS transporter [bacterium]
MNELSSKRLVVTVLTFTGFIAVTYGFGVYLFPALAPAMRVTLNFNFSDMGLVTGLSQAGFLLFALISGLLTSKFGAFNIMRFSMLVCLAALVMLVSVESFWLTVVLLTLLGGSAASVWVPMAEVSQQILSRKHQGRALGLMSSGTAYGVFVNSIVIGAVFEDHGWRMVWAISAVIVAALCIYSFVLMHNLQRQNTQKQETIEQVQTSVWSIIRSLPKGATLVILVMMFFNGISCLPFQTYLSSVLVDEHGYSLSTSATSWQIIGLVGMASGFSMGWVGDRIGLRWALVVVYIALILATSILLMGNVSFASLVIMSVAFGIAFYAIFGLVPAYISQNFRGPAASIVFAAGNIALGAGGIIGNSLGGVLRQTAGSFDSIYILILVAAIISTLLCPMMRK